MRFLRRLILFCLLGWGAVFAQSIQPACKGSDTAAWSFCNGTANWPNGQKYVGEWKGGKPHGKGSLIYGIYVEFTQSICPLTYLENMLLQKAKLTTYSTSFIQNYLFPIIYPVNLTKDIQINLAISLIILNAVIYGVVVIKYKKN